MQYYYIVAYIIVGDDFTMCKVGLNPHQLIKWGRKEATKHPERTYELYRQPITSSGVIKYCKDLAPFAKSNEPEFNWDEFEASRGADMDIDIHR